MGIIEWVKKYKVATSFVGGIVFVLFLGMTGLPTYIGYGDSAGHEAKLINTSQGYGIPIYLLNANLSGGGSDINNILVINGNVLVNTSGDQYLYQPNNASIRFNNTKLDLRINSLISSAGLIEGVTAGTGLLGGGSSGTVTLNANTTYLQRRVSYSCGAGSSIRVINEDGTVTCESDSTGSGTVTDIYTSAGLTGGHITTTGTIGVNYSIVANKTWVNNQLATVTYYLNTTNILKGTPVNMNKGNLSFDDNKYGNVTEATGALPIQIYFNFTNVDAFNYIHLKEKYIGGSGHIVNLDVYNYNTSSWDTHFTFSDQTGYVISNIYIDDYVNHISLGKVILRILHSSNGNPSHRLSIDSITLTNGIQSFSTTSGTVTSITAGTGLTGGIITTSGTIALNDTYVQKVLDYHDIDYLTNSYNPIFTGLQQKVTGSVTGYGNTEKGYWRYFSEYNGILGDGVTTGTVTYTVADSNVWGVLNCATESAKGNDCAVSATTVTTNSGFLNATKILKYEILTKATETTTRREVLGIFRTQTNADIKKTSLLSGGGAEGFGFYSSTNTSDYATSSWKAYTCRGGTCTVQNTTVNLDTSWHKFTIVPHLDGYSTKWVAFYVDEVLKNNITTNLPLALVNVMGAWVETDRAGSSNFKIDTMLIEATR